MTRHGLPRHTRTTHVDHPQKLAPRSGHVTFSAGSAGRLPWWPLPAGGIGQHGRGELEIAVANCRTAGLAAKGGRLRFGAAVLLRSPSTATVALCAQIR